MAKNRPNISIADKSVTFCRDVRFGLLIEKKYGPTGNSNSDACWCHKEGAERGGGRIYRTYAIYYPAYKIAQNVVCRRKIGK